MTTALNRFITYTTAVYTGQAFSILRGVLLAALLTPTQFGLWRIVKLLLDYAQHLPLGAIHFLRQELPAARGKNKAAQAKEVCGDVLGWLLVLGLGVMFAGLAAFLDRRLLAAWPAWFAPLLALLIAAQLLLLFIEAKLMAEERVTEGGAIVFAVALIALITMPLGAWKFGVLGAFIGLVISMVVPLLWLAGTGAFPHPQLPSWARIRNMQRIGGGIWLTWVPVTVLGDVDQWLVASQMGAEAMGHYGIVVFFGSLILFLPNIFRSIYLPYFIRHFSADNNPRRLSAPFIWSLYLMGYASPFALALIAFLCEPLLVSALPAYQGSIPVVRCYVAGCFWWMIASVTYVVCLATRRKREWFAHTLIAIAAHSATTFSIIRAGYGLSGVALATAGVFAVYGIAQVRHTLAIVGERAWLAVIARLLLSFTAAIVIVGSLLLWPAHGWNMWVTAAARTVIAWIVFALLFRWANQRFGFTALLHAAISPTIPSSEQALEAVYV